MIVIGSIVVVVALLILGWAGEIVAFFIGDGGVVSRRSMEDMVAVL